MTKLANDLNQKKIIKNADYFKYYIKYKKTYKNFQAGRYKFEGSLSSLEVMDKIIAGETFTSKCG